MSRGSHQKLIHAQTFVFAEKLPAGSLGSGLNTVLGGVLILISYPKLVFG
jgi:hypothetical protein